MDIATIAATLTTMLTPCLPTLLGKVADGALQKVGEDTLARAKRLWGKLSGAIAAKPVAQEAATDLAQAPDDPDLQAAFRVQLKKLLEADPELKAAIAQLLADQAAPADGVQIQQTVSGNQNITVGQMFGGGNYIN